MLRGSGCGTSWVGTGTAKEHQSFNYKKKVLKPQTEREPSSPSLKWSLQWQSWSADRRHGQGSSSLEEKKKKIFSLKIFFQLHAFSFMPE